MGQYSAGKSSILKVMTGREDIEIGGEITTQQAQQLDWNEIKVVDTPGIHTELRPDHDEITYEAISKADLLVFVITNELFDSHIADHFRKLAIDREKAHEMLLVVNKMQQKRRWEYTRSTRCEPERYSKSPRTVHSRGASQYLLWMLRPQ